MFDTRKITEYYSPKTNKEKQKSKLHPIRTIYEKLKESLTRNTYFMKDYETPDVITTSEGSEISFGIKLRQIKKENEQIHLFMYMAYQTSAAIKMGPMHSVISTHFELDILLDTVLKVACMTNMPQVSNYFFKKNYKDNSNNFFWEGTDNHLFSKKSPDLNYVERMVLDALFHTQYGMFRGLIDDIALSQPSSIQKKIARKQDKCLHFIHENLGGNRATSVPRYTLLVEGYMRFFYGGFITNDMTEMITAHLPSSLFGY